MLHGFDCFPAESVKSIALVAIMNLGLEYSSIIAVTTEYFHKIHNNGNSE